ncbi:MAG TPA: hypothetical protein VM580_22030, partial [Labilithrix sp.]|nr:hypothetical protein [Labilithrix sp.]
MLHTFRIAFVIGTCALGFVACSVDDSTDDTLGTAKSALKRRDVDHGLEPVEPPPPPPPPADTIRWPGPILDRFSSVECASARYDGQRTTRACADLPGAVADGSGYVLAASGGTWKIDYIFPADTPAAVRSRACSYTWIPTGGSSCAPPDMAALALDEGSGSFVERTSLQLRS